VAPPSGADRSGAEADFVNAKSRFDQGDEVGARAALDDFSARHADDPMRPSADVLRARLALVRGEPAAAKGLLEPLSGEAAPTPTPPPATPTPPPGSDEAARAAGVAASARYFLGLAELRLGNARRARELLLPYLAKVPKSSGGEDSAVELYGALAEATAGSGDAAGAIALWDTYFQAAKEHERAFARMRAEQLAAQLSGEASWRAFGAAPQAGLGRAVLGPRAAVYLRGQGDASGATFIDGETAKARHALGFDESGQRVGPGDPTRLGLALPLSGKFQPVGEATLRAAMLAAGSPGDGSGSPSGAAAVSQLVVRDTGTDAERAAHGVSELTREEAVIGILGAGERKAGAAALA
jgi:hypothetical protein